MSFKTATKRSASSVGEALADILVADRFFVVALIALGLWAVIFVYRTVFWFGHTPYFSLFDDAMISMRYALHLAEGNGLVWNEGEAVEGYTNPLWTLWMAGLIAAIGKHYAPLAMQVTGLFLSLAAVAMSSCAAREYCTIDGQSKVAPRTLAFGAAFMLVATLYPLHYWSLLGMEVALLAALAAGTALILVRVKIGSLAAIRGFVLILSATAVAYFTRPDGFLVLIPLLAVCLVYAVKQASARTWVIILVGCGVVVSLVAAHLAWRLHFYGILVPNTYILKMEGYSLNLRLSNGLFFLSGFVYYGVVFIFTVLLFVLFLRDSLVAASLIVSFAISVFYQIYVGGDPWDYWRQLVPGLVLLYIGLAISLAAVLPRIPRNLRAISFLAAFCGVLLLCVITNARFAREILALERPYQVEEMKINVATALALRKVLQPNAKILSFWAGTIPYYWGGKAIDPLGKTDSFISHRPVDQSVAWSGMKGVPGHAKYDLKHSILEAQPDYIQYSSWGTDKLTEGIYVTARYMDLTLCLRKNSSLVRWQMVEVTGGCP